MREKPVIPRQQANRDIDETLAGYLGEGSVAQALSFIETLEQACAHIARHPATGTVDCAHELNLPGLRCQRLESYPHLVFYAEHTTHIDVWRVLDARRDIPAGLQEGNNR